MPVPTRITDISTTAASNSPAGSDTIGTTLDDYLRGVQATFRTDLASKGADVASTATADVGAVAGFMHDITGTTAITGLGTVSAGIHKVLKFEGALVLTHNGTSLILPGAANITTANGDVGWFISEGSGNWRCLHYQKAAGGSLGPVMGTVQASTSGTTITFGSIPSWVKKITVNFAGVSTNGTDNWLIRLGDADGLEDSGYLGAGTNIPNGSSPATSNYTAGFGLPIGAATAIAHGSVVLTLLDPATNTWSAAGNVGISNNANIFLTAGSKALSGALTQVGITTSGGTDAFDAGSINTVYE